MHNESAQEWRITLHKINQQQHIQLTSVPSGVLCGWCGILALGLCCREKVKLFEGPALGIFTAAEAAQPSTESGTVSWFWSTPMPFLSFLLEKLTLLPLLRLSVGQCFVWI